MRLGFVKIKFYVKKKKKKLQGTYVVKEVGSKIQDF